jgi:hypothetical protein
MNNAQRIALAVTSWAAAYMLYRDSDYIHTPLKWLAIAIAGLGLFILLSWQKRN